MDGSRRARWAIALGCAVLFAGCGGTGFARPSTPAAPAPITTNPALQATLARAVQRTSAQRSARTSISVTLTGLGNDAVSSGAFDVAGTGVVDFGNGDADLGVSIPQFDRLARGAIEQRIVGGVVYTRLPPAVLAAGGLPASVRWLSLDPKRVGGADPSALSQAQVNPAGQLALLGLASAHVRKVGSDSVRAVATTRYTAMIDLGAAKAGSGPTASARARLAALGAAVGNRPITADVWLDRSGCARRVVVTIPLASAPGVVGLGALGPEAMMRIQGDFYGFGAPVHVVAPPRAQVRSYAALRIAASAG